MNGLNQCGDVFDRRELADAMPQIENLSRPRLVGVDVGCAELVQHGFDLHFNLFGRCKKDIGIQIALKRFTGSTHAAAHSLSSFAQVDRPVESQSLTIQIFHLIEPNAPTFGEDNAWNFDALVLFDQL